ncbi:MAG: LPS export ABC transporter periplasmic protein LptC [Ectothiorhodospiraceae bacterium]|nr:LPS export ABC transporter periplasmic protein LptC [Chromatiales bacterium]MCP5157585.1 LPS export ABC transporter periplasmic protein LptC [Ectothiorhodospiraceae bacterium]
MRQLRTWWPVLVLFAVTSASTWLLWTLEGQLGVLGESDEHVPDLFVDNFVTTTLGEDGRPQRRLEARQMSHFSDTDTSEFAAPYLVIERDDGGPPWHVRSDRGWLSAGGDVLLLLGPVRIWRNDPSGALRLDVETEDLRVLPDTEYGETDRPVVIRTASMRTEGVGMRAHLSEGRMELLSDVRTVYRKDASFLQ